MSGTVNGEPWADVQARLIAQSRRSYPKATDDLEAVCLALSNHRAAIAERNEAWNKLNDLRMAGVL